ncbi:MAG: methyltransferase domain-containing protein [Gemmataceae bacterium]|nr:methyltransferase domain-containing protein [Gemmataceae bacterium]
MMSLEQFEQLLSPAGQVALAAADALAPTEATYLRHHRSLTRRFDPDLSRVALEQAMLRLRAREKFPLAAAMYFTREGYEQATCAEVARYRASRLVGKVVEACCGIGGDTQALAARGPVVAIDADPLRLAIARENVRVSGHLDNVTWLHGDLREMSMPAGDVLVFDPDRRATGRRSARLIDLEPPLSLLSQWRYPGSVVKLAPATPWAELDSLDAGIEFVSLAGELKECTAWMGGLRGARRRATLLPAQATLAADVPAPLRPAGPARAYLYDPDPAVTRAGLVTDLAERIDAGPLDSSTAFLTADHAVATPFARGYAIEASLPFHLGRLREYLRSVGVGRVTIIKRGSAVDVVTLTRHLKLQGPAYRYVMLTPVLGKPTALICRPLEGATGVGNTD